MRRLRLPESRWKKLAIIVGALAVPVLGLTARWFMWPPDESNNSADAIVLLAGGRGERYNTAVDLAEAGKAPVLVLMNGTVDGWNRGNELCAASDLDYEVVCPTPDPDTTRGEAQLAARMAESEGWTSILLVTSDYHMHRGMTLVERCMLDDVRVYPAPGTGNIGIHKRPSHIVHEWLATAVTWVDRTC